jgi:putative phage-type endonuclease
MFKARIFATKTGMSEDQWLAARRKGIGASEASAVAGINPWLSPLAVYYDKLGELPDDARPDNEAIEWGLELEKVIAARWSKKTGIRHIETPYIWQHKEYDWMICNLDFIFEENGVKGPLEIKTTNERNKSQWIDEFGDTTVPDWYMLQKQHQLAVMDCTYGYISCLIGGQQLVWKRIERDDELIAQLIEIEKRFWEVNVMQRILPPAVGLDTETELLKLRYPKGQPTTIELPLKAKEYIEIRNKADKEIKAHEKIKDAAENELRLLMGENEIGIVDDITIRYTEIKSKRIDSGKLKKEQPEIFEMYANENSYRRFYF